MKILKIRKTSMSQLTVKIIRDEIVSLLQESGEKQLLNEQIEQKAVSLYDKFQTSHKYEDYHTSLPSLPLIKKVLKKYRDVWYESIKNSGMPSGQKSNMRKFIHKLDISMVLRDADIFDVNKFIRRLRKIPRHVVSSRPECHEKPGAGGLAILYCWAHGEPDAVEFEEEVHKVRGEMQMLANLLIEAMMKAVRQQANDLNLRDVLGARWN